MLNWSIFYLLGGNTSQESGSKIITIGKVDKSHLKCSNAIITSKYTALTFIPKNLFEQFRRLANFYLVVVTILTVSIDSPISPVAGATAVGVIIIVAMLKQAYEDWLRHRKDAVVNNRLVLVEKDSIFQNVKCHQIRPGDLVKVVKDENIPCDSILLKTSNSKPKCFATTANLDGETNLKSFVIPEELLNNDNASAKFEIPPATPDIYQFEGRLSVSDTWTNINTRNLLLRGSVLKNMDWIICCAVYTGEDTKLAMNSKYKSIKFSSCESKINRFLLFFIVLLVGQIEISYFAKRYFDTDCLDAEHIGPCRTSFINDAISFLILFNYYIPVSLYVTVEMHKFVGSLFFIWDNDLTDHDTGKKPLANTSDLNEELGQIQILFSDKTGTLTTNNMQFKYCAINGNKYVDIDEKLYNIADDGATELIENLEGDVKLFFEIVALCHSIYIDDSEIAEGLTPNYMAASPDELTLVKSAANYGIIYSGDEYRKNFVRYKNGDVRTYEKICGLDYTSSRARMSIVFKDEEERMWLFCKGADNKVFPMCRESSVKSSTMGNIQEFAEKGLRTMVVAYKELAREECKILFEDIEKHNNDDESEFWKTVEQDMTVLGATGIEDQLQDNVTGTIDIIRQAGIKIWVLTGDKTETAINVSQSCGHLTTPMIKLFLTNIDDEIIIENQLKHYTKIAQNFDTALIVDGSTLSLIFNSEHVERFINLTLDCSAVLGCRLAPLQKSQIVSLIKRSKDKPITAAIGDGANDISMIQEAHIGLGILGSEGNQAARAADFAFAKFMMLEKILLVHGHWYYERFCTLYLYTCYKNIAFISIMFAFQFHSQFSTQSIFDSMHHTYLNLLYASGPILFLSLSEQRYTEDKLLKDPTLYRINTNNSMLSWKNFAGWCALGFYHGFAIFYMNYGLWAGVNVINVDGKVSGLWCFGISMFHCLVYVMNFKLILHARYQNPFFIGMVIISIIAFMGVTVIYPYGYYMKDGDVIGVYERLVASTSFWFTNLITMIVVFIPDYIYRYLNENK